MPEPELHESWAARALILLVSRLLPRSYRGEWRREWTAELTAARTEGRSTLRMALGALPDAWTVRRSGRASLSGARGKSRRKPLLFDTLGQDLRYALRGARRNPGFAAAAVLTLALGIGANTAIFSVVDGVLLRPLPYRHADRLVTIASSVNGPPGAPSAMALSYPDYRDIGRLTDAVAGVAAYSSDLSNFTNSREPRELQVTRSTAALFSVLGVSPVIGHTFSSGQMHDAVAVISHALWISSFNGDKSVLGRMISLDDTSFTIVGVMPAGFAFPEATTDVWIPIGWALPDPAMAQMRMYRVFSTVARLARGVSLDKLRGDLDVLAKRITASGQATSKFGGGEIFTTRLLRDQIVGDAQQPLLILLGAVALVLLIACVNAASLLVARANTREKDFAVRRAIGAGRWAIVRQLLVESILLALGAAVIGLGLAAVGLRVLRAQLPHGYVVGTDARVLGFTILLAMATGLGFGVVPALRASAPDLERSLHDGTGGTAGRPRRRARGVLVVSEVALALVLLVGSALLVRSFISVNAVNPGFDARGLLLARIHLTPAKYATMSQKRTFFDDLVRRLRTQPGVGAVTLASSLPLSGMQRMVGMNPRGLRPSDPDQFLAVALTAVGPDFFSTMRIPILKGRALAAADDGEGSKPVVVVSQALADELWPHENPIGQGGMGRLGNATVVGVAGDVRSESLRRKGAPAIYQPLARARGRSYEEIWIVVRSAHPLRVAPELREVVRAEDPSQPIASISTYDAIVQRQYAGLELITALITLFSGLALVLAVIGIAGVTAYTVSQRTRELGIRIAMGARAVDVLGLLLGETVVLVAIGLGVGVAAALGLTRTLRSLLYGVTSTDPVTFGGAALALGLVALVATYLPARHAVRIDPAETLRQE